MVCIYCGDETHVINSRLQKRSNQVWRRRRCTNCRATFTTHEAPELGGTWRVQIGDNLYLFSRDKLLVSIYKSVQHRSAPLEDASALVETVISQLRTEAHDGLIEVKTITMLTHLMLERFDMAAATHYRAFHPL